MASRARAVVGLDAGGTTTSSLLVDEEGAIHWQGSGGPASITRQGVDGAADVVGSLWEEALAIAQEKGLELQALAGGFAGGRSSSRQKELEAALSRRLRGGPSTGSIDLIVTHDAHAALVGALGPVDPGCIVISGTGSVCMIRTPGGQTRLAGGWGWPLGDEGSGTWVGMTAVRRALAGLESDTPALLLEAVLEEWGIDPSGEGVESDLMREAATAAADSSRYPALAPVVLEHARANDPTALEIVAEAGLRLGSLVAEACDRSGWPGGADLKIVLSGGFGRAASDLLEAPVRDGAGPCGYAAEFVAPLLPPEGGAALLALRAAGIEPDQAMIDRMRKALR